MTAKGHSVTAGLRVLMASGVPYTEHLYSYAEKGGTGNAAKQLGVEEHAVVKTLVMEDENETPLIVLMHGDKKVSYKNLARAIGAKQVKACSPEAAQRHTGYRIGGISPFGLRKPLPIYAETTIQELDEIYINIGHRGFLVGLDPKDLFRLLTPTAVEAGI